MRRVLDVTGFAVYAVLCIDLQPVAALRALDVLVNTGRAVAALGSAVGGQVDADRHAGVLEREVRGLVFFVVGVADEHAGQPVKTQLAVGLGVVDLRALLGGQKALVVSLGTVQGPGRRAHTDLRQEPLLYASH